MVGKIVACVPPGESSRIGNPLVSFAKIQIDGKSRLSMRFGRLPHAVSGGIEGCLQMGERWSGFGPRPFHAELVYAQLRQQARSWMLLLQLQRLGREQ